MNVLTLTVTRTNIHNKVTVMIFDADKVTIEEIDAEILDNLGEGFTYPPTLRKSLIKYLEMIRTNNFKSFFIVTTKSNVRFMIKSKVFEEACNE